MRRTALAGAFMTMPLTMLMAGGCASRVAVTPVSRGHIAAPSGQLAPIQVKNDCSEYASALKDGQYGGTRVAAGALPATAYPVSLIECRSDNRDVPGQGQWQVVDTVRSTGSIDAFINALRAAYVKAPQPAPSDHLACPAVDYSQPWVATVDADGKVYALAIPFWGVCSAPDPEATKALDAVTITIASTERIKQVTSPGAQASGCGQQFAEMAFVNIQHPGGAATSRPFSSEPNPVTTVRACFYKITDGADKAKPAGDFEAAATITGSQSAIVYDGLMNAPITTAKACAAPAAEYAVVSSPDAGGGSWSVVELDGCKLAAPNSGPDRQAPAAVIDALLAAKK